MLLSRFTREGVMDRKRLSPEATLRRLKGVWRDQVIADRNLTYFQRIVAYWLADSITMAETRKHYERTEEIVVFCSQAGIADKMGKDPADVSRAISALRGRLHLMRVQRGLASALDFATNEYLVVLGKRRERMKVAQRIEHINGRK
jgi:hypothetical protein